MSDQSTARARGNSGTDAVITKLMTIIEYAIVVSLVLVASVVLARTLIDFFTHWGMFSQTVVAAIDGILVVIILLDIAHTVFGNLRTLTFPVRPFLVIGILAGVRDILSASAHLTLNDTLAQRGFTHTLVSLGVGVGVVVLLLVGLLILRFAHHEEGHEQH